MTHVPHTNPDSRKVELQHISSWTALTRGKVAADGATPLIAAMRAYVASKFGDEVPDA